MRTDVARRRLRMTQPPVSDSEERRRMRMTGQVTQNSAVAPSSFQPVVRARPLVSPALYIAARDGPGLTLPALSP